MSWSIEVQGGSSVRLPTKGKYCDRDIVVTATGGSDDLAKQIITRTITEIRDDTIATIGSYAFAGCAKLTDASFANCTIVGYCAFHSAASLVSVNLPKVNDITSNTFQNCTSIKTINFPELTRLRASLFQGCSSLEKIDLPKVTTIDSNACTNCSALTAVILRSKCVLNSTNSFNGTPIANGTGYFYVHANLIDSYYRTATNWAAFQFRAIEDYPDICGG